LLRVKRYVHKIIAIIHSRYLLSFYFVLRKLCLLKMKLIFSSQSAALIRNACCFNFIAHSSQNLHVSRLGWPQCNLHYFVKISKKLSGKLAPQQIFRIHLHTVWAFFVLSVEGKENTCLGFFLQVKWLL